MNTKLNASVDWNTTTFGSNTNSSPIDILALGEHLQRCKRQNRHVFALQCMAEKVNDFVAARIVTMLVIVAVLTGIGFLIS